VFAPFVVIIALAGKWSATAPDAGETRGLSLSPFVAGWSSHPSATAASDGSIYGAWAQHTNPAEWEVSGIYVKRWTNGAWQSVGARIGHRRGVDGAKWASAYAPSLAVVGTQPYIAWYEGGGYGWGEVQRTFVRSSVFVAHWDGSNWVLDRDNAVPNGALNTAPDAAARTPKLAVVAGVLHAAWIETRGDRNVIVVKRLTAGQWTQAGSDVSSPPVGAGVIMIDVALADVAGVPYVAWTEFRRAGDSASAPLRVVALRGAAWTDVGGPLNTAAGAFANQLALAASSGTLYVAWQERALNGNNQVHVKVWKDMKWSAVGGPLNQDPDGGEAGAPALASLGSKVWLAWAEAPPGKRAALRIRTLDGGGWSEAGPPLNVDPAGAADSPTLAASASTVSVVWVEKALPPATKQVYAKELH